MALLPFRATHLRFLSLLLLEARIPSLFAVLVKRKMYTHFLSVKNKLGRAEEGVASLISYVFFFFRIRQIKGRFMSNLSVYLISLHLHVKNR